MGIAAQIYWNNGRVYFPFRMLVCDRTKQLGLS